MHKPPIPPLLGIAVGIVAVSFSSIFIRLADAPSLVIAAYRLSLASLILAVPTWLQTRDELRTLTARDPSTGASADASAEASGQALQLAFLSGAFLALHFATWIASLDYTTVASSVVLVDTSPIFVALMSPFLLREQVSRSVLLGIGIAFMGGMVVGFDDFSLGGQRLLGDGLALAGAITVTGYFLIGRWLRPRLSLLAYVFLTYAAAALALLALCLITRQPFTGYSTQTYVMFLLLALVPQIIGHSAYNWALRYVSATFVSVAVLGDPVGSTILAALILKEIPTTTKVAGGLLILAGIYVASRGERALQIKPVGVP